MKISNSGLILIKKEEGFSPVVYKCSAGFDTIGYGHRVLPGEHFTQITPAEAEQLLIRDTEKAQACINQAVKVPLSQNQFDALVCFVFNVGIGKFISSTLLKLLNQKQYAEAAQQFLRWNKANGKELKGLTRRRQLEHDLFLQGCTS